MYLSKILAVLMVLPIMSDATVTNLNDCKQVEQFQLSNGDPITLTYEQWNELLRKKVIEVCENDFNQEFKEYLFRKKLTGLSSKEDEIVYNLSRDNKNIISLEKYSSNGELKFLVAAFKKAFDLLTKNESYIVPSAVRKFYDYETKQVYDFRMKLGV